VRRDSFTDEWHEREQELRVQPVKPAGEAVLYGQSAAFVDAVLPAADVVRGVSAEAERILRQRPRELTTSR
jgi:nitronate monooxygenase